MTVVLLDLQLNITHAYLQFVWRHVAQKNERCIAAADDTRSLDVLSVERECRSETVRRRQIIEGRRGAEAVSGWAAHLELYRSGLNIV